MFYSIWLLYFASVAYVSGYACVAYVFLNDDYVSGYAYVLMFA